LKVNKSVTLDLKDVLKVRERIKSGKSANLSEFVRIAMKEKLKGDKVAEKIR
jgi:Arc/MetJ-type ribon-helix-helix transcriptional regulator